MGSVSSTATFAAAVVAGLCLADVARAAPQIVAAVPYNGPVQLTCDGAECVGEFSTICLQQSRFAPHLGQRYGLVADDRGAVAVTGRRADGTTVALPPEVLGFTALRVQLAFRVALPADVLRRHGLVGVAVELRRMATLVPAPRAGDRRPQTAVDVAQARQEARTVGAYWADSNQHGLAKARLVTRVLNRLPETGAVTTAAAADLWRDAAAREAGLAAEPMAAAEDHVTPSAGCAPRYRETSPCAIVCAASTTNICRVSISGITTP